MKGGLLYFHQGWTDIINSIALINYYSRLYDNIYLLMRSEAKEIVDFYTRTLTNIKIIYIPKNKINCVPDVFNYLRLSNYNQVDFLEKSLHRLFIGCHDNYRNDLYKGKFNGFFVNAFYTSYDIPYITRINDFTFKRDYDLEDNEYEKFIEKHGNKYILYHEVIENYDKSIKIVNLNGISDVFFDMIKIIENSVEIHLLDSVWGAFIYQLDAKYRLFKNKKIVLYAKRGYTQMFTEPIKLDNWIMDLKIYC
jgi:hypothetical protein